MLSVREILSVIFERRVAVLTIILSTYLTVVTLAVYVLSPTYAAESLMIINVNTLDNELRNAGADVRRIHKDADFQTQKDVLHSAFLVGEVVKKLDLANARVIGRLERLKLGVGDIKRWVGEQVGIEKWTKPVDLEARAIDVVLKGLSVTPAEEGKAVRLRYQAKEPEEAADILNELVRAYTRFHYRSRKEYALSRVVYLEEQVEALERQLLAIDFEILALKKRGKEGGLQSGGPDDEKILASVTDNSNVQMEVKLYLLNMEEKLRLWRGYYSENDNRIRALNEEIGRYLEKINRLPEFSVGLEHLQRKLLLTQDMYFFMKKTLEQVKLSVSGDAFKTGQISVLQLAKPNYEPISPKKNLLLLLGVFLSFSLAITWAFFIDRIDPTLHSVDQLTSELGVRTIGSLPKRITS